VQAPVRHRHKTKGDEVLFAADSPLRNIPTDVPGGQVMFLDGIRYSAEMLVLAYGRLVPELEHIALASQNDVSPGSRVYEAVMLDAWSVVDSANRLRTLLEGMRGIRRTPGMELFIRQLAPAEDLRNAVQHLRSEIPGATDEITWGSIAWVHAPTPDARQVQSLVLIAGSPRETERPAINPAGNQEVTVPVGAIELTGFGHSVSLTRIYLRLLEFAPAFEQALRAAFANRGPDTLGSDVVVSVSFEVGGD
jgi:hypothetical protein